MINELNIIENLELLLESTLILYGAGLCGIETYYQLRYAGIGVAFFCDSESTKWGEFIDNVEIVSPEKLIELDREEDLVVIISTNKASAFEIIENLEKLELRTRNVITLLGLEILFAQNANNPRINKEYRDFIFETERWRKELSVLKHKSTFMSRINYTYLKNNVLVYLPAKVGSSTICSSLNAINLGNIHVHLLVDPPSEYSIKPLFETVLDAMRKHERIRIITLIREPIARAFSLIFQSLDSLGPYFSMSAGESFINSCTKILENDAFRLKSANMCFGYQFDWFDYEMKSAFDVDVFQHPFDKEKGYSIIKQGNVEVLLMKLEKLNSLESIIGQFVGAPHFKLINANEGSKKIYKHLYKNVREVIKIPREIVDLYYKDNPRMDHFYTEEEKAGFLKKWECNIAD